MWSRILPARLRSCLPGTRPGRPSGRTCRRPASTRLAVEALEARTVPSFLAPVNYAGAGGPPAVGDFNSDGIADLVATNFNSNSLSVRLGNGDGTFQAARTSGTGPGPG